MDILNQINKVLPELSNIDKHVKSQIDKMSPPHLVVLGLQVWVLSKILKRVLDPIKTRLRELTEEDGMTHRWASPEGPYAIVLPQPATLIIREGTNMDQVKDVLGDHFDTVFDTVVTYRPKKDIQDRMGSLTKDHVALVMAIVDVKESSAKVEFKD